MAAERVLHVGRERKGRSGGAIWPDIDQKVYVAAWINVAFGD